MFVQVYLAKQVSSWSQYIIMRYRTALGSCSHFALKRALRSAGKEVEVAGWLAGEWASEAAGRVARTHVSMVARVVWPVWACALQRGQWQTQNKE